MLYKMLLEQQEATCVQVITDPAHIPFLYIHPGTIWSSQHGQRGTCPPRPDCAPWPPSVGDALLLYTVFREKTSTHIIGYKL